MSSDLLKSGGYETEMEPECGRSDGRCESRESRFLEMSPQPDDTSCGPTCLHAVYSYYGDSVPLSSVIDEVETLSEGGTLAVNLANHALERGYSADIYTVNIQVFDPSWFNLKSGELSARLEQRALYKTDERSRFAVRSYRRFLELGGRLQFRDISSPLIKKQLGGGTPVITGLSSTWLYRSKREIGATGEEDDLRGEPAGHFVVLVRYDMARKRVLLADPYAANPVAERQFYYVRAGRLINSILLGVLTYDSNLLVIRPA